MIRKWLRRFFTKEKKSTYIKHQSGFFGNVDYLELKQPHKFICHYKDGRQEDITYLWTAERISKMLNLGLWIEASNE